MYCILIIHAELGIASSFVVAAMREQAILGECSTLWGERERGSVVGMGVYVSSHRKLIGHIGCCCSPQLLAFSAGRAHTG